MSFLWSYAFFNLVSSFDMIMNRESRSELIWNEIWKLQGNAVMMVLPWGMSFKIGRRLKRQLTKERKKWLLEILCISRGTKIWIMRGNIKKSILGMRQKILILRGRKCSCFESRCSRIIILSFFNNLSEL